MPTVLSLNSTHNRRFLFKCSRWSEEANELRKLIQTDRVALESNAAFTNEGSYNGEMARKYRAALISEMMAASTVRNSYIDGVEVTISKGSFSPVYLFNLLKKAFTGEDWMEAIAGLREHAENEQEKHELQFADRPSHDLLVKVAIQAPDQSGVSAWPVCEEGYGDVTVHNAEPITVFATTTSDIVRTPIEPTPAESQAPGGEPASVSELLKNVSSDDSQPASSGGNANAAVESTSSSEVAASAIVVDPVSNATVIARTLNVRAGPSTTNGVILQLKEGHRVNVIARTADGTWMRIETNSRPTVGWVAADFVTYDNSSADIPVDNTVVQTPTPTPAPVHCQINAHSAFASLFNRVDKSRSGCPLGNAYNQTVAYQSFEHGAMYWRKSVPGASNGVIYVLFDTGAWEQYMDTWVEGQPERAGYTPPTGRLEPRRGFGKVWRESLGGPSSSLGWALQDEVGSDFALVQDFPNYGTMIRYPEMAPVFLPDGLSWLR